MGTSEDVLPAMRLLDSKKAVVTGAASGIGRACAVLFAKQGASLLLIDKDRDRLISTCDMINSEGGSAELIQADLTVQEDIKKILYSIDNTYNELDILVNCAGGGLPTSLFDMDISEWRSIIGLNLEAVFVISRKVAEKLRIRGGGSIVNISSLAGRSVSVTAGCHYTSSKAGLLGLTRHMAKELACYNIRVNAICPGVIGSERIIKRVEDKGRKEQIESEIPLGRIGDVNEIATCCLFFASDLSSYATGATLDVNGGLLMI